MLKNSICIANVVIRWCIAIQYAHTDSSLGIAFREIKGKLFPSVGMKKAGEHVRVNFGQSPFVFDIDSMMAASLLTSLS